MSYTANYIAGKANRLIDELSGQELSVMDICLMRARLVQISNSGASRGDIEQAADEMAEIAFATMIGLES